MIRGIFTWVMILGFFAMVYMGPLALVTLVSWIAVKFKHPLKMYKKGMHTFLLSQFEKYHTNRINRLMFR